MQVATSQYELVHRLLDRKTEPLVSAPSASLDIQFLHHISRLVFYDMFQDKLVLRVKTANDEVAHLQDFEYGGSQA